MTQTERTVKKDQRNAWIRVGKWIIKVCIMALVNSIIVIGYFIYFKPWDQIIFSSGSKPLELAGIEQIAAYAIDNAQQSVVLLEWFIVTLMSIFAGVVAYLSIAQINANKELQRMRIQAQEIIELKKEWANQIAATNKILRVLPRRILPPDMVDSLQEQGEDPNREDLREAQQWFLWQKWIVLKQESGYKALKSIRPNLLSKNIKFVIFLEIEETKEQIQEGLDLNSSNDLKDKLEKLQSLLSTD